MLSFLFFNTFNSLSKCLNKMSKFAISITIKFLEKTGFCKRGLLRKLDASIPISFLGLLPLMCLALNDNVQVLSYRHLLYVDAHILSFCLLQSVPLLHLLSWLNINTLREPQASLL